MNHSSVPTQVRAGPGESARNEMLLLELKSSSVTEARPRCRHAAFQDSFGSNQGQVGNELQVFHPCCVHRSTFPTNVKYLEVCSCLGGADEQKDRFFHAFFESLLQVTSQHTMNLCE